LVTENRFLMSRAEKMSVDLVERDIELVIASSISLTLLLFHSLCNLCDALVLRLWFVAWNQRNKKFCCFFVLCFVVRQARSRIVIVGLVNCIIFAPLDCNACMKWQKFTLFHIFFLHLTDDFVAIVRTIGFVIGEDCVCCLGSKLSMCNK
jgi:hypothetical protein